MSENMYSLTNPQKSIWLTGEFYKGTSIENITGSVIVSQNVDFGFLKRAINLFVKKNDSFRLKFTVKDGNPMQYVDSFTEFDIEIISVQTDKDVKHIERKMCDTPFNTLDNFLFDFKLFKFPNGNGGFIINAHHLISDAWTAGLVVNEIMGYYEALIKGEKISDEPNPSYIEYINSEKEYLNSEKFTKDKAFWNEMFETIPEVATIPSIKQENSNEISCASKRKLFTIPKETMDLINAFCKSRKASAFNFFMGVLSIYLSRVSNLDEFVIGTPILNRGNFKEKQTTGMYISTIPFKVSVNSEDSFGNFLSKISTDFLKIFRHQKYPYQYLLEDLRTKDSSIPNLYNILISYQNVRSNKQISDVLYDSRWIGNNNISDDIDIHLYDMNDTGNINIAYDYLLSKYTIDDICSIHARILHIINQILENNEIKLKDIEIVTPDEKRKILYDFNNTKADYPKDKTISQLFEEQVAKTPDNVALVFEDKQLTYRELNERANSLAYYLRDKGVGRNDIVGIMVNRSLEMIVSILAVLKSGACYIPIDPEYPQDRIEYMLDNSNAKILLTFKKLEDKVDFSNKIFVELNNELYDLHKKNLENINDPDDLAYIIYTSGSTGKPKGVMLIHKSLSNLTNYCNNYVEYLKDNKYRTIVSVTTVSFDIFIFETLISLQKGLKLVITNEEEQTIPRLLNDLIEKNNIEIIQTTPSRMQLLVNNIQDVPYLSKLKFITLAGEQLPISLVNDLKQISNPIIYNGYGPSETTVFSSLTDVTNHNPITIGRPLDNTQIYILSSDLNMCPIEVSGEIYIAGDGVGHGYINNEDLTKKSYLQNMFSKENKVLYKTGDLGYYRSDGEIMCLGRCDNQVKIRGLRIELEEIENEILNFENIANCVVIKQISNDGHESLCAYFTSSNEIDINNLRNTIQKKLPKYMVPQHFVQMEQLPYTPNGKIDKNKLPAPNIETRYKEIELPRNNTDELLINILKGLLHVESISIDDSFFELGGDSLTAINLCTKIYSEFNVQIFVKDILENPITKDLSDLISSKDNKNTNNIISKATESLFYPASSAQVRTYYASNIAGNNSTLYNISGGLILDKVPNISKFENAFNKLIKRQPSLRTYFEIENNEVVQKIKDNIDFKLDLESDIIEERQIKSIFDQFVKPFDLSKAPLFRAKMAKLNNGKALLAIDMHHIISDGASLSILVNDVCKIYNNEELPDLKIDYKDYAVWENNSLENGCFKEAEDYWLNQFNGEIPVLNLPTKSRPAVQSFEGNKVYAEINKLNTEKINNLAKNLGVTPYMLLLSVYYVLLSKYTSQEDIVVGTPIVNRNSSELYDIVGMFVNSLPIRVNIDSNLTFNNFINNVKDICLQSYKYQDYPFDELVNKLNLTRDTSRNPLFDTMFIYQSNGYTPVHFNGINAEYYIPKSKISKFDLSLEIVPNDETLSLSFEYATKLFDEGFIKNLSNHYINILNTILDNNDIKIADICMLSDDEKNKILYDFNNTKANYPKDKTISQLFEEQVEKTPDNIAIVFENQQLTYRELNERANSLAYYLRNKGVGRNDIVGIMVNRSLEMIVSILAVLKSGGAYLLIDPSLPIQRINYMINNSKLKLLITLSIMPKTNYDATLFIDDISFNNKDYISAESNNLNDNIAIIYTSGSTGAPKGVLLHQKGFINLIYAFDNNMGISKFKKHLSMASVSFDMFSVELFSCISFGNTLYLLNEDEQKNPIAISNLIYNNDIEFLITTPTKMDLLVSNPNTSRCLIKLKAFQLGGEIFTKNLYIKLKKFTNAKIYNGYGPTEITACCTNKLISSKDDINIGTPISNTKILILNKDLNLCPIGVPGELCISGDGVSYGYIGNSSATKKSFTINNYTNQLIYRSGDIALFNSKGELEYIGRNDSQIKLRGLRIELSEIEKSFLQINGINKCVIQFDPVSSDITAFYTSVEKLDISFIKSQISAKLPLYMIPKNIIQIDEFKMTSNGKVDTKFLKDYKNAFANNYIYTPPENKTQELYCQIWENILNKKIGIDDNIFEFGADSLLAIKFKTELLIRNIDIPYSNIFKYPTIRTLSNIESKNIETIPLEDFDYTNINKILSKNITKKNYDIKHCKNNNILLLGGTGFVGMHILNEFIQNDSGKIYCIIRDKNNISAINRFMDTMHFYFGNSLDKFIDKRIFIFKGDITKDNFALNNKNFNTIKENISVVINAAANVKHYGNFEKFKSINIDSTIKVIDFCKKHSKRLIHLSTLSISGNLFLDGKMNHSLENNNLTFNEGNLFINQTLDNVYTRSKFEAEKIILENISSGLNAQILRLGNITSRYSDGTFQINPTENAFANRLKVLLNIKCIPDNLLDGYIEFTPVDFCSKAIISVLQNSCNFSVLHIYNHNHLNINKFVKMLKKININIKILSEAEFSDLLKSLTSNKASAKNLEAIINDLTPDNKLNYSSNITITSDFSINFLKYCNFKWPKINLEYLNKYINYLQQINFLEV